MHGRCLLEMIRKYCKMLRRLKERVEEECSRGGCTEEARRLMGRVEEALVFICCEERGRHRPEQG